MNNKLKNFPYKIEISARHVHLSEADFFALFGAEAHLNVVSPLGMPGEFKSDKTVTIVGVKRNIERVSVLGPFREQTQVEISTTDTYTLGIKNVPVRLSGDLQGSAPVTLRTEHGEITLSEGLIIAQRHIHVCGEDMTRYGLVDGQEIDIKAGTKRAVTFHNVTVRRAKPGLNLDPVVHLDTDEGNVFQ